MAKRKRIGFVATAIGLLLPTLVTSAQAAEDTDEIAFDRYEPGEPDVDVDYGFSPDRHYQVVGAPLDDQVEVL